MSRLKTGNNGSIGTETIIMAGWANKTIFSTCNNFRTNPLTGTLGRREDIGNGLSRRMPTRGKPFRPYLYPLLITSSRWVLVENPTRICILATGAFGTNKPILSGAWGFKWTIFCSAESTSICRQDGHFQTAVELESLANAILDRLTQDQWHHAKRQSHCT